MLWSSSEVEFFVKIQMLKSVYEKVSIYAFKITFSDKNENVYAKLYMLFQIYCFVVR